MLSLKEFWVRTTGTLITLLLVLQEEEFFTFVWACLIVPVESTVQMSATRSAPADGVYIAIFKSVESDWVCNFRAEALVLFCRFEPRLHQSNPWISPYTVVAVDNNS